MNARKSEALRVAVYCRIATQSQMFGAMATQKKILRTYAERLGKKVVAEVSDIGPGDSLDRPGIQELIKRSEQREVDEILALDPTRIARNAPLLIELMAVLAKHDVQMKFAKQPEIQILDLMTYAKMEECFRTRQEINRAE